MTIKILGTIHHELDSDGNVIREITQEEVRRRRGVGCRTVADCVITSWPPGKDRSDETESG